MAKKTPYAIFDIDRASQEAKRRRKGYYSSVDKDGKVIEKEFHPTPLPSVDTQQSIERSNFQPQVLLPGVGSTPTQKENALQSIPDQQFRIEAQQDQERRHSELATANLSKLQERIDAAKEAENAAYRRYVELNSGGIMEYDPISGVRIVSDEIKRAKAIWEQAQANRQGFQTLLNDAYYAKKYESIKNDLQSVKLVENANDTYRYINDIGDARGRAMLAAALRGEAPTGYDNSYDFINEDERLLYNYLYAIEGEQSAQKYLDHMQATLDERRVERQKEILYKQSKELPVLSSLYSVGQTIPKGAGYIYSLANKIAGEPIDTNSKWFDASRKQAIIRDAVSEDMSGVGSFLYNTGMSIADFLTTAAVTGGMGTAGEVVNLGIMGLGSATDTTKSALERGATEEQALTAGFLAGAAEIVFEKVSLEHFISLTSSTAKTAVVKNALKQSGIEASEETFTEIANIISDVVVMGDLSEYKDASIGDLARQIGLAALGGGLSGGITGSVGSAIGRFNSRRARNQTIVQEKANNSVGQIQQDGISLDAVNRTNLAETDASTEQPAPIKVGRATTIKNPYTGPAPKNIRTTQTQPVVITNESLNMATDVVNRARNGQIDSSKSFKSQLAFALNNLFGSRYSNITVPVTNTTFNGEQYNVQVYKNVIDKVVADKVPSAAKYAVLNQLESVIENADYVGSGKFDSSKKKTQNVIRYDYFETPIELEDGTSYIVAFDAEVSRDENKLRTYKLNNVDLIPLSDTSHWSKASGLGDGTDPLVTSNIPQAGQNMQGEKIDPMVETQQTTTSLQEDIQNDIIETENVGEANEASPVSLLGQQAVDAYGAISPGTNPVRNIQMPRQVNDQTRVSQFARTAAESSALTDAQAEQLQERVILGEIGNYVPRGDKTAIAKAKADIQKTGISGSLAQWEAIIQGNVPTKTTKDTIAFGEQLLTEVAAMGDTKAAMRIIGDLCDMAQNAGQTVQAFSLLKKLTPEGKLYYIQKRIDSINKQNEKRISKGKTQPVTLSEASVNGILQATNEQELAAAERIAYQDIAAQIPATLAEKINTWRHFAMLANFKTHLRNLVGNAGQSGLKASRDTVSEVLQRIFLPRSERTTVAIPSRQNVQYAKEYLHEQMQNSELYSGGKGGFDDQIQKERKTYNNRILEFVTRGASNLLEYEDTIFLNAHFVDSFAKFMTARGLTPGTITGKDIAYARAYAVDEALKATYHDASAAASALNKLENTNVVTRLLIGGSMPYKKTPINVAKRAIEYSPVGLIDSITRGTYKVIKGDITSAEYINDISAGVTGSVAFVLGSLLASLGIIRGSGEDDDNYEYYLQDTGEKTYSLNIGDVSIGIEWLSPVSIPLFMGVELYGMAKNANDGITLSKFLESAGKVADPITSMSFLSSLDDVLEAYVGAYGQGGGLGDAMLTAVSSYITQFIPTLSGQLARTIDQTRRTTAANKASGLPTDLDKFINQLANKLPGVSSTNQPYIDRWGREQVDTDGWLLRALKNFVSPAYISIDKKTTVDDEVIRLYKETGESGVVPQTPKSTLQETQFGVKYSYILSESEYTAYKKEYGQALFQAAQAMIESDDYQNEASDLKRAEMFSEALSNAGTEVKKRYIDSFAEPELDSSILEFAKKSGIQEETLKDFLADVGTLTPVKDANGKTLETIEQQAYDLLMADDRFTSRQKQGIKEDIISSDWQAKTLQKAQNLAIYGVPVDTYMDICEQTRWLKDESENGGKTKKEQVVAIVSMSGLNTSQQKHVLEDLGYKVDWGK